MSEKPTGNHAHKWVKRDLKVAGVGRIIGWMCRCGARDYIDLVDTPKHRR